MGFIRSGVVIFFSVILFVALFLGNLFLTLSWSLEYETAKPQLSEYAEGLIDEFEIRTTLNENYDEMTEDCLIESIYILEQGEFYIEIPCDIVSKGPQEVISYGIDTSIYNIYYKEYTCSFWECLKEESTPFVLVSEKSQNYWQTLFYWALLISIIIFVLMFLFSDSKNSPFIISGILMAATAFPFRKIDWVLKFVPDSSFFNVISVFFTKSFNVFLIMTIIGVFLFLVGIAFNLFGVGMKISGFFSKVFNREKKGEVSLGEDEEITKEDVKDLVKEEVEKAKGKEKLRSHVKNLVKDELKKGDIKGK